MSNLTYHTAKTLYSNYNNLVGLGFDRRILHLGTILNTLVSH